MIEECGLAGDRRREAAQEQRAAGEDAVDPVDDPFLA
jgi:hypothetical protein